MSIKVYSWLSTALEGLPQRLPGASLIYGQKGLGKQRLARAISQSLLCQNSSGSGFPCGTCDDCHLFEIGNHPDFRLLQPEKDADENAGSRPAKSAETKKASSSISVDAVRDLSQLTTTASHRGGAKVVMISPAEALNSSAANALLKMLEEPSWNTHFILVAHDRNRVLPTIRSRCFQLPVKVPPSTEGTAWLKDQADERAEIALALASYAPFAALELTKDEEFWNNRQTLMARLSDPSADPLELASVSEKLEPRVVGRILSMWVFDLLVLKQGGDVRYHRDMQSELEHMADIVAGPELCRWSDEVRAYSRAAEHPLNRRLALESLYATWPGFKSRVSESHYW
ncbi:MAG: DNA polymerase III subunit delta' [Betaproteobacteria bacterium]|nr:MAG: DNA polymerase III subunit delta' [Betaproteobacteria bacterium]